MLALICWAGAITAAAQPSAIAPKPNPSRAQAGLKYFVDIIRNRN